MQLQFQSREIRCMGPVARETTAQEATQEVKLTDGMPDIGRVLASWGQIVIRSKEWRGDTVFANGGVMVWILYAPEDGSENQVVETWIPYQLKWDRMEAKREGPVHISPMLRGLDARVISPRKLMVRAGTAASAEAWCPEEHTLYFAGDVPEDVQLCKRTYPVRLPREAGEKTFQVDEEVALDGLVPEKIIAYTVKPSLTETRILTNRILFRGGCNLHLIYSGSGGRIRTADFEVPFSQYADLDESYGADSHGNVGLAVTNLELNMDDQNIWLKCGLVGQYRIDDRDLIEVVEDAYSTRREVSVDAQVLQLPAILEERAESLPVTAKIRDIPGNIIDIGTYPDIPRHSRNADGVEWEIPGQSQIVSVDESGDLHSATARWEIKTGIKADEGSSMYGRVVSDDIFQTSVTGDGMELRGKLQLQTETTSNSGIAMVTGMEIGEAHEKGSDRPSLILRRHGGESLWQLAKSCGSTVDAIREVNGIQEEPETHQMLLIPLQ